MSIKDLLSLSGRVALVTGGSRGLGLSMTRALAEMGARVAISARHAAELQEAQARLRAAGYAVHAAASDVSRREAIAALVDSVIAALGPIDILINNAGTSWGAPASDYPLEGWQKCIDLNLTGTFLLAQEVARRCMIPRQTGSIINIASVAGLRGTMPDELLGVGYFASKGGMVNMTRALAAEWGAHNIRVNTICPGFIPTKLSSAQLERNTRQVLERTPLGRLGQEDDLQGLTVLLASDAGRHISGQAIAVDGGRTAV
ncbi:MAG TPA: SDR family oxidoreductase [Steroidobacteraceae bacterium]|nr:SDR family oxidoreductase [Steroidobacteraceae bacterium]